MSPAILLTLTGDPAMGNILDKIRYGLAKGVKKAIAFIPGVGPAISAVIPERMLTIPARALKVPSKVPAAVQNIMNKQLSPAPAAPAPVAPVAVLTPTPRAIPWVPIAVGAGVVVGGGIYLASKGARRG